MSLSYQDFIARKSQLDGDSGFDPTFYSPNLFDFQRALVEWAVRKGRAAVFADCGLGKTAIQLNCAQNVVERTNGRVLILTPLAVGAQTVREAEKFGVEARQSRDGKAGGAGIVVTNYEKLHLFDPADFAGVVCDESSILKNYAGSTRNAIIDFLRTVPYRFLMSATPSPNDFTELGNSVEALGVMRRVEMLSMFFIHDGGSTQKWRLKGHARDPFWRFVAGWARAIRNPADLGFDGSGFVLPPLNTHNHVLPSKPLDGYLFAMTAATLAEQRQERRETLADRCDRVGEIANDSQRPFAAWCSLNSESERLAKCIAGAAEITGSQSDEEKEELMTAFASGELRAVVTKPSIAGFGMNWQHCGDMSFFPSHSHEQFYQALRRCWRFGREGPVNCHIVTTESESAVLENLMRKEAQAAAMFAKIAENLSSNYARQGTKYQPTKELELPSWL